MKKLITILISLGIVFPLKAATVDNIKYSASSALTLTANSLAASATACRQSTVIDNSTNLYIDAYVTIISSTSNSALGSSLTIPIYISGSEDGTNFDHDNAALGASDAGYTINAATNLKRAALMNAGTSGTSYVATFSVAQLFGGVMPRKWAVVECNDTNQTLAASGNSASFTGITFQNQ